jgi:cbb3-type cytochrome oxidase maturation protein
MGTIGWLIVLSLCLGLGAWLYFLWSVKSGQYDDPEGPKYRMLEDDDEPPKEPRKPGDVVGGPR